jgi:hypothetical protein
VRPTTCCKLLVCATPPYGRNPGPLSLQTKCDLRYFAAHDHDALAKEYLKATIQGVAWSVRRRLPHDNHPGESPFVRMAPGEVTDNPEDCLPELCMFCAKSPLKQRPGHTLAQCVYIDRFPEPRDAEFHGLVYGNVAAHMDVNPLQLIRHWPQNLPFALIRHFIELVAQYTVRVEAREYYIASRTDSAYHHAVGYKRYPARVAPGSFSQADVYRFMQRIGGPTSPGGTPTVPSAPRSKATAGHTGVPTVGTSQSGDSASDGSAPGRGDGARLSGVPQYVGDAPLPSRDNGAEVPASA